MWQGLITGLITGHYPSNARAVQVVIPDSFDCDSGVVRRRSSVRLPRGSQVMGKCGCCGDLPTSRYYLLSTETFIPIPTAHGSNSSVVSWALEIHCYIYIYCTSSPYQNAFHCRPQLLIVSSAFIDARCAAISPNSHSLSQYREISVVLP